MSIRPSKNYPPELRERAIRLVGEIRAEYISDWAAVCSVATKLGIGGAADLDELGPQGAGRCRAQGASP